MTSPQRSEEIAGDSQLWEALLEAEGVLGHGIAVVDIETQRFLFINDALCGMFGYTADEILALPSFFTLMPPAEVAVLEPDRQRRIAGVETEADRYDPRVPRKDGGTIDVETSVKPLPSLPGSCMIAVVRDVTEQRERERELSVAEQKYRELVERLPVVTYVAEPGETGRWVYVSPQIERMVGYTQQEWQDDPELWARCIHPEDLDRVIEVESRIEKGERLLAVEYRMITRGGGIVWVSDEAVMRSGPDDGGWLPDGLLTDIPRPKASGAPPPVLPRPA